MAARNNAYVSSANNLKILFNNTTLYFIIKQTVMLTKALFHSGDLSLLLFCLLVTEVCSNTSIGSAYIEAESGECHYHHTV